MQARKAPAATVGHQTPATSTCRLQTKRSASREVDARQGCTVTEILEGFSNRQAERWQWQIQERRPAERASERIAGVPPPPIRSFGKRVY